MTGYNLPPGVSVRDLPGNRPEDEAGEARYDAIYERLQPLIGERDDKVVWQVIEELDKLLAAAYGEGYAQGKTDEAQAQDYLKGEYEKK